MINLIKEILFISIFSMIILLAVIFWGLAFLPRVVSIWAFSDRTFREAVNKILIDSGLKDKKEEMM